MAQKRFTAVGLVAASTADISSTSASSAAGAIAGSHVATPIATPIAADTPIAGAPRTTMVRIA